MHSLHFLCLFFLPCLTACQPEQQDSLFNFTPSPVAGQDKGGLKSATANIVFQSTDGGQIWQDISAGLPMDTKAEAFFVCEGELLLGTTDAVYRSNSGAKSMNWEKDLLLQRPISAVSKGSAGVMAICGNRNFFQKLKGTDVWMPIFTDFEGSFLRTVFTAEDGNIFIGSDNGLFKSADQGRTWKHVVKDGWVIKMVESNGVLLCTNEGGILRSTDGGEHWEVVLSEGGVGIDVAGIKNGFAAITFNTETETRRIRTSTDGGKTWQAIDESLPPSSLISTILQVGNDFFCGHPDGIYRSIDQGKNWQLVVPAIGKKVFNLSYSNGVMYALLREGGC